MTERSDRPESGRRSKRRTSKLTGSPSRSPLVVVSHSNDRTTALNRLQQQATIFAERNLLTIGYFSAASGKAGKRKIVELQVRDGGSLTVEILGVGQLGLPTTADLDKYFGLLGLVQARGDRLANPVRFKTTELLQYMGISEGKWGTVAEWLRRMRFTGISGRGAVYLAESETWLQEERMATALTDVRISGQSSADGSRSEENEVWLSAWHLANLREGYARQVDMESYRRLRTRTGKLLMPQVAEWLSGGEAVLDYKATCALLGLETRSRKNQVERQFRSGLNELAREGYIAEWGVESGSRGFALALSPGAAVRMLDASAGFGARLSACGVGGSATASLGRQLASRGSGQRVMAYLEAMYEENRRTRKIRNFGGWARRFVEDASPVPEDFVVRLERAERAAAEARSMEDGAAQVAAYRSYVRDFLDEKGEAVPEVLESELGKAHGNRYMAESFAVEKLGGLSFEEFTKRRA